MTASVKGSKTAAVAMPQSAEVPIEVKIAQKLASNEPKIRDRAVKKLTKWLSARSASTATSFSKDEMLRLWKGLYYCFWMSDKPLVQEELAENIGKLIHCFEANDTNNELFIRCFLETLGREWLGIDRLRMDKYMMLTRRCLRHIFVFLAKRNWAQVDTVVTIFEEDVVRANKAINNMKTALGFQMHFVDIFLEELAKVGGEDLSPQIVMKLLAPFITEIARGSDMRLCQHIEERIFRHLMRQSDIGLAYEGTEEDFESDEDGEDQDDDEEEEQENEVDMEASESEEDEDLSNFEDFDDPRGFEMDVSLPQLNVDYSTLSDALFAAGDHKKVNISRRKLLNILSKQFKALGHGKYPLAIEFSEGSDEDAPKPAKAKKRSHSNDSAKAKKNHAKENGLRENSEDAEPATKQSKKLKASSESEATPVKKKRDKKEKLAKKSEKVSSKKDMIAPEVSDVLVEESPTKKPKKSKKSKNQATPFEEIPISETEDSENPLEESITKKPKSKNKISEEPASSPTVLSNLKPLNHSVFLRKALSKSGVGAGVLTPPAKKKEKAALEARGTQSEPKMKRKLNWVLSQNAYQTDKDHERSIRESPSIPYDSQKTPKQSALKRKHDISVVQTPSPASLNIVKKNTLINSKSKVKRMMASDFF